MTALNKGLQELRNGVGLIGINGPPGTGKTTLLREVVADVVVNRAKRLLKCNIHKIFQSRRNTIADAVGYYEINEKVFGNDGILVASNNNKAAENISKELPLKKSIDAESFPDARYFIEIANKVYEDETCWGMLSAVLGNAGNINQFISRYWYSNGFGSYLSNENNIAYKDDHQQDYDYVSQQLQQLLEKYEKFQQKATAYHEIVKGYLSNLKGRQFNERNYTALKQVLITEYDLDEKHLVDIHFSNHSIEDIHKMTPYSSPILNKLRSEIFLRSLELHACTVNINAKYFRANLDAFQNMLAGKHTILISREVTLQLWNTFFFCIPVVSATLASIEKLFSKMEYTSLGWLLLDEAGQATPQSACGAIWRSKNCIVIGDTLQVPPVVTIPEGLGKILQQSAGVTDDCWSPVYSSTQLLADRVTRGGTHISINENPIWTGLPLRAHRRCDEPMFSIANHIAYNDQMVKVTEDTTFEISLGKSQWINVSGTHNNGHIIAEEINKLGDMLKILRDTGYRKKVFIISPFKAVANECSERFSKYKFVSCGTIHRFQGQETEIVFVVLGSDPAKGRARDWVTQTPNMLNVAFTRAKKRIYVIGNARIWAQHKYMKYLIKTLNAH